MLISNAFSLNMLAAKPVCLAKVQRCTLEEAQGLVKGGVDSAVGHADTAALFSTLLGVDVPCARRTVELAEMVSMLVGQYKGPRLPEGTSVLPEGAVVEWLLVTLQYDLEWT